MIAKLKSLYRRLPSFSPRFHIAFGLSSLVTSVVLLSMFLGFIPDRQGAVMEGRVALAEAVSASNSVLLKRGDLSGMRGSLEFIVDRNPDLNAIELMRASDGSRVFFGAARTVDNTDSTNTNTEAYSTSLAGGSIVSVPLLRGEEEWGQLHFQYGADGVVTLLDEIKQSALGLMLFIGVLSFPVFYFYLGKMLKELNPSNAVPARVRSALDTIAESLLVLDARGNVVLANAAFSTLSGRDADSLTGVSANSLSWIQVDEENPTYPWEHAFETGEPTRMDMVGYVDSNGEQRKFIVNCSPVMGGKGKVGGVLISMDDVTLLEEKELLLRQSMEEAEAANHAKTAFLSNMSHEIRTPMTAILGFTEVLKRGLNQSEEDRIRHLNTISNSGTHLLELINDVLDLSKVESGAMEVETIPCKAAFISNEVVHVLQVKAREKGISLDLEVGNDLPAHIFSDPSRLRQIVTNLVGNAIKFTEEGGVTVRLEYTSADNDPRLLIKVIDSGIGMSEKQLSTIFEAFIQADASITRRFGGTGLGLSISRKLALAMNGDIVVSSEEGKGSTFMLTLPTGDISQVPMLSIDEVYESFSEIETVAEQQWTFPECHALVVDDGPENRELLSVVLGELGITITTAENGQLALEQTDKTSFDVVLMDIQMPVMDGYQAVAEMRKRGVTNPVVALTANAMKGYEQKVIDAGFSHYMTKPIDIDRLTVLLGDLLGGTCTDVEPGKQPAAKQPAASTSTMELAGGEAVYSSMAQQNPKFQAIAEQFVVRLTDQIAQMRSALTNGNYDELAGLAHWLKGSGGTVGFTEFALPAKELETAANNADEQTAAQLLDRIENIRQRIRFDDGTTESAASKSATYHSNLSAANPNAGNSGESEMELADKSMDSGPIACSLPMDNERFRGIAERFMPRLDEQLSAFEQAIESGDLTEVAQLAHWLKGSGGNVGYDGFTRLAASLETSANEKNEEQVLSDFAAVVDYADRVKQGWKTLPPLKKTA